MSDRMPPVAVLLAASYCNALTYSLLCRLSVCLAIVSPAKTAEPIETPFAGTAAWVQIEPCVRWRQPTRGATWRARLNSRVVPDLCLCLLVCVCSCSRCRRRLSICSLISRRFSFSYLTHMHMYLGHGSAVKGQSSLAQS